MTRTLTRRDFLRVGGAGLAGTALLGATGCGGGSQSGGEITLTWWDYWTEGATDTGIDTYLKRYMKAHPNVTIERTTVPFAELKPKILRAAAANQPPDIIGSTNNVDHASYASAGLLADITGQVENWGQADKYFEAPWETTVYGGKNYGVPNSSNCLALFVNRSLLEQAGVEPPTNWDELTAAVKALSSGDNFGLAVSGVQSDEGTFQWLPFFWQAGGDIENIDSPAGRDAMELWVDYVNKGYMSRGILGWTQQDVLVQFQNGKAAMMVNGPWQVPVLEGTDLDWQVVPLPEGAEVATAVGGENTSIAANSENAEAAWDLITWMQRPDNLENYLVEVDRLPSRADMANNPAWADDPALSVFVDQFKFARSLAFGPKFTEISAAIQDAIQASVSGNSDVDSALSRAQTEITKLLKGGS